jgi:integrase
VSLSTQALDILRDLHHKTGQGTYVFPGRNPAKPMSDAAVNAALRRLGYDTRTEICGHGFRALARTLLHEELGFAAEVIEHQLAHRVADALGAAYNRTRFLKQRREMMQRWSDYLDELKPGGKVVAINSRAA